MWWIDRWRQSSAYTDMTLEEQGAYRNLLDEATLRGGPLPDNNKALAKASGDALAWPRLRRRLMARFVKRPDGWHHETLDKMLHQSTRRAANQKRYRDNASDNGADNAAVTKPTTKPTTRKSRGGHKRDNEPASQDQDLGTYS